MKDLLQGLQIDPGARRREGPASSRLDRRARRTALVVGLAAILAAFGVWRVNRTPVAVDVFAATRGTQGPAPTLTAGGYARAARVVYVAPRVPGRLAEVNVEEGDEVRAGDIVAVIDSRDLEQEVAETRGQYDFAAATLRRLRAGSRPEEVAEADARVQAVARATERAEKDLTRSRALFDAGLISAQAFDAAEADYLVGQGNLDAARQSLALVVAGPRAEELEAAEGAAAAARARWVSASHRLGYAKVRAPIAGRVLRRFRNVGDFVSPDVPYLEGYETIAVGSPVVSLADLGRQEVSADVNETDIGRVSLGQAVEVAPSGTAGEVLRGGVTQISPRADRNKNTIEVKVTLEGAAPRLAYDSSVKLTFLGPASTTLPSGVRIPARAVVVRDGRPVVFVVAGSRASLRVVETGGGDGEMVAVTAGLADGERVVVSGAERLGEGTPVRVR